MTTLAAKPFQPWDMERTLRADRALTPSERLIGCALARLFRHDFTVPLDKLPAQALIGARTGARRETVNRALAKMVRLGYFRSQWKTVQRLTKQGIKGVTRVMVSLGPVFEGRLSPSQRRGVTDHHTPRPPREDPGTLGADVVTERTGSKGVVPDLNPKVKQETLGKWSRLARARSDIPDQRPSSVPAARFTDPEAYRVYLAAQDALFEQRFTPRPARMQPRRVPRSKRK